MLVNLYISLSPVQHPALNISHLASSIQYTPITINWTRNLLDSGSNYKGDHTHIILRSAFEISETLDVELERT
jgi:hypothetical protein